MIIDLFKTGIYREQLKLNNQWLKKYCHDIKQNQDGVDISNSGGFHSDNLNMNDESIRELMKQIISSANVYSEQLGYGKVKLSNIWCNINSYKDYNKLHCHPNAKVSGVYYVKTPENCGDIEFHNTAYHVLQQSDLSRSNNPYTSIFWWMPAEEGILYLFPSWLMHLVRPNMNKEEERISFSFNLS
tara:strand:- start:583 stop:1140 length:558 start_codon:yes stop_codon:yes gene_type:complete